MVGIRAGSGKLSETFNGSVMNDMLVSRRMHTHELHYEGMSGAAVDIISFHTRWHILQLLHSRSCPHVI